MFSGCMSTASGPPCSTTSSPVFRIEETDENNFDLHLSPEEQDLLARLGDQLRDLLLQGDSDALVRLFPPAYTQDEEKEAEFRKLMRDDLLAGKLNAIEVVEQTAAAQSVTAEQLHAWMTAINDLRLVLGTVLDVTEDMDDVPANDPRAEQFALYGYLSSLLAEIVEALGGW